MHSAAILLASCIFSSESWRMSRIVGEKSHAYQSPVSRASISRASIIEAPVTFANPLEYDGFIEPDGWGTHAEPSKLPLLCFLPGMDGSIWTPWMQYPELGTEFELSCMRVVDGSGSRASFDDLVDACALHVASVLRSGRRVVLVGESFGACLGIAVARKIKEDARQSATGENEKLNNLCGLVLVNPGTSFEGSAYEKVGSYYPFSFFALAALVLNPVMEIPAFISMSRGFKLPAIACSKYREAYLGRVALALFLGRSGQRLRIAELFNLKVMKPDDFQFRLNEWLRNGAAEANSMVHSLDVPSLIVVGEEDHLLPSVLEAHRLHSILAQRGLSRGIVSVPGAGHSSTLGPRINLMAAIRHAFGEKEFLKLRHGAMEVPLADDGNGWARGLVDRPYPEIIDPDDYTRYNNGGDRCPTGNPRNTA